MLSGSQVSSSGWASRVSLLPHVEVKGSSVLGSAAEAGVEFPMHVCDPIVQLLYGIAKL